jgi:tetratricopeptide (TPR) repeat protein
LDRKGAALRESQRELSAKQQELVKVSARGRLQELAASTGQLSAYAKFVANQVQQKTTNDFTEVIPLLDDASARAHVLLIAAEALATDIKASQLFDDGLTAELAAQRDALNQVVADIQTIAQEIAAKPSTAHDQVAEARKLWQEGYALAAKGQAEPARLKYEAALKRKSSYAPAINSLGVLHYKAERFVDAEQYFRKATVADPRYVASHTNLALALIKLGRAPDARAAAESALKLRPGYEPALNILSSLDAKPSAADGLP